MKNPLTPQEQKVMDLLAQARNEFNDLPTFHGSDNVEFMQAIHAAQNIVCARVYLRYQQPVKNGLIFFPEKAMK